MNPRIKQLAGQAGYYQEQDVDGSRFDAMPRQCFEKFAELIVNECLELNAGELPYPKWLDLKIIYKEHFGVE